MTKYTDTDKRFDKKFVGFTIPDTVEGRFTASLYKSFLHQELDRAYDKGYEDGWDYQLNMRVKDLKNK